MVELIEHSSLISGCDQDPHNNVAWEALSGTRKAACFYLVVPYLTGKIWN
jgi:hypothetical protein